MYRRLIGANATSLSVMVPWCQRVRVRTHRCSTFNWCTERPSTRHHASRALVDSLILYLFFLASTLSCLAATQGGNDKRFTIKILPALTRSYF
jgi:hypothetical protein